LPQGLTDMEQLNWLNSTKAFSLTVGRYTLEDMLTSILQTRLVRRHGTNREPGTFILGDSGGFQIAKGLWEGDWKANSGCAKAQKKREL
jgi:hypothetical protein